MRLKLLMPLLLAVFLIHCRGQMFQEKALEQMDYFYTMFAKGELEKSLQIVGDEGFEKSPRERWLGLLRNNIRSRGVYQSHRLNDWDFQTSEDSVKTVTLILTVNYENGQFIEKAAFREQGEKRYLKLVGYDSDVHKESKKDAQIKDPADTGAGQKEKED